MKLHAWTLLFTLLCCASSVMAQQDSASDGAFAEHSIVSRDVLVASGDTFRTIAKRELGREGLAPLLAAYNGLVEAAPLNPGQIVRIPIHVPARVEFAQVIFTKGSVSARRNSKKATPPANNNSGNRQIPDDKDVQSVPLTRNAEVYPGDLIGTGDDGFASIEFSSGSVINLQPNTEAIINRLNCQATDDSCVISIKTLRGKVTSNVQGRQDQPVDFRISTPYASAAVRGTVFDIHADLNTLKVGVTEGVVDLSSEASDQKVALEIGFGSIVKKGEAPSEPIALLSPPVFKRIPARMAVGDTINWWPNSQAMEYAALVSTDAAGSDTLTATEVSEQRIGFDELATGDYFLTLRAIDSNGLQGFSSSSRITIAEIDQSLEAVNTAISKQGAEYLVEILNPVNTANGYEIQISDTASFDDPLTTDIDPSGTAVFRLDEDKVFTRARVLIDPFTVSAFGPTAESIK